MAIHDTASVLSVIKLNTRTLELINDYEQKNIQWVYIPVAWFWKNPIPRGHASFLVIDTKAKKYGYFDPTNGKMHISKTHEPHNHVLVNRYDLMENTRNILIPGYRVHRERQQYRTSVQAVIESHAASLSVVHAVPGGLCSPTCFLIIMLCRRYAFGYPWKFADAVCTVLDDKLNSATLRENFRSNLVHWWKNMYGGNYKKLEKMVGLRDPEGTMHDRRCMVVSSETRKPCQRRPCDGYALCAQHRRQMINNWPGAGDKCEDEIMWDRFKSLPSANRNVPVVLVDRDPNADSDSISDFESDSDVDSDVDSDSDSDSDSDDSVSSNDS